MVYRSPVLEVAPPRFRDRAEAGRELGRLVARRGVGGDDVLVLGLPRGGVPVAAEVARVIGAPLDVFVVRTLGVPGYEGLAFGAIASGGVRVTHPEVLAEVPLSHGDMEAVARAETLELARREHAYRGELPPLPITGRTVVVVDDGLATATGMRAAVRALSRLAPARVVVAVPLATRAACAALHADALVAAVVCARMPEPLRAVAQGYEEYPQTRDGEVRAALAAGSR